LIGRLDEAERQLTAVDPRPFPPASRTAHELLAVGIALRRLRTKTARAALARAQVAAREARIPALTAEVESTALVLNAPAARLIASGEERLLVLEEVEELLASKAFIVDACRHVVRAHRKVVVLGKRPVLFALVRALAEAWPEDVPRHTLVARAFGAAHADESHRARLRVEARRLRAELRTVASVRATKRGSALAPRHAHGIVVLAPTEEDHGVVLALLADGESWSSSALALALGTSQCSAQRALDALATAGVESVHGVTYDGRNIWFAAGDTLNVLDPASGEALRSIEVAAHAGTAFDGKHLLQLAEDRIQKIDPATGHVLATIPAPGGGGDSGLAWAEGTLWVGQYRERKIHQIDPDTGAILRSIESNRFVTGVTWVDGELWHGTW
jgi:hypothetical protein